MNENISRRGAAKLALVSMVLTLLVAVPAAVWASHHFNDVPTGHPFHDQISAIADAGITTGFGDGGFHPSDPITRQAMAAFMERGLGRVAANTSAAGTGSPIYVASTPTNLTSVAIDAGAEGNGTAGFVSLAGVAHLTASVPSSCPCHVELSIWDVVTLTQLGFTKVDVGGSANEFGSSVVPASVQAVARLDGGATGRYTLRTTLFDAQNGVVSAVGSLTAVYIPFGPDGDDTLMHCSALESEPNNSFAQAKAVTDGQRLDGCISSVGESDYFVVSVPGGETLLAETYGLGGSDTCDMDTYVHFWNSVGQLIGQGGSGGWGYCAITSIGLVPAGTYYVGYWAKRGAPAAINSCWSSTNRVPRAPGRTQPRS